MIEQLDTNHEIDFDFTAGAEREKPVAENEQAEVISAVLEYAKTLPALPADADHGEDATNDLVAKLEAHAVSVHPGAVNLSIMITKNA